VLARLQQRTSLLRTAHTRQGPGTGDHTHHSQGSNLEKHANTQETQICAEDTVVRCASLVVKDERNIQETATYDAQRICAGCFDLAAACALAERAGYLYCCCAVLFPVWRTAVRCCCIVLSHRTASVPL
jgi:hypothetical protein